MYVFDEIETLVDQNYLQAHSTKPEPYYSEEYLTKVKKWHAKLMNLNSPSIFILTRNNKEEIDNIINTLRITDWGTKVTCFEFSRAT